MAFILTPPQERALDISTHLSVTANAGAGKTSVLARRFVEIFLASDARLSEVVAITFTEQAAAELRKRIHDVIVERERDPGIDRAGRLRMSALRNQLSSAVIGTIHAFCARILRMYPAEADIDAAFGVLEGQERARLVTESVGETFSEWMEGADGAGPSPEFRELLRAVPPPKAGRFLLKMFSQREQIHRLLTGGHRRGPGPGGAGGDAGTAAAGLAGAVARRALESDWIGMAWETARAAAGRDAAKVLELLGRLGTGGARGTLPDPGGMADLLAAAGGLIFTKEPAFRKSFTGAAGEDSLPRPPAEYLLAFETRYAGILRALLAPDAEEKLRRHDRLAATLMEVFLAAQERYRRKKDDLGVLDFEDLQIMTGDLLRRDAVRKRIQAEYRFFLVDEFQDTNDLQYGILRGLLDDRGSGNLFIVGDPKQSIYGFRNADVGVFYDARNDIAEVAGRGGTGRGDGGAVVLEESFRPLPAVAAFVNALFSRLMKRGGSRFEVDYNRIVVGRDDPGTGSVEMLLVPAGRETVRAAGVRAECALVAARLRDLASGADGSGSAFGEIAVLLRDRTNLPELERAFEEAGIPYLLAGGVGFFQTQEVYDFLNYLRFLVATDDGPALAGILRSPFFSLSDAELYEVSELSFAAGGVPSRGGSRRPGDLTLWEKLVLNARGPGCPGPVRRAWRTLTAHLALADRIPVPRLLRRIAADTGWIGTMAGLSHGPQHRENFLKLLELARGRVAAGAASLYDFTVYLDARAEEEEREGQAATAPGGKAVRVMTIHAAKGLEFPVVFLPFLDRPLRPDREPIIDPVHGIGFRPGTGGAEEEPAPRYDFLRAVAEEKRIAEEKRVLYVGCTRAKDLLVLSASEGGKPARNSAMGWLRDAMEAIGVDERDSAFDFGDQRVLCLERKGGKQEYRERIVRLVVRVGRPGDAAGGTSAHAPPDRAGHPPRILSAPVADTSGGETYSATRLATYLACPALYYLSYVLGAGEGAAAPRTDAASDERSAPVETGRSPADRARAALEGELTHQILSGLRTPVPEESVEDFVRKLAPPAAGSAGGGDPAHRAGAYVSAFLRSDAGRAILSGNDARTEFQISALLGDAIVTGKIDRLWRGSGGLVEFVDYKTDALSAGENAAKAEAHTFQMSVYAYLISRLHSQAEVRGTLLFLNAPSSPVVLRFDSAALSRVERELTRIIEAIRSGRFTPPSTPCRHCPGGREGHCPVVPALP